MYKYELLSVMLLMVVACPYARLPSVVGVFLSPVSSTLFIYYCVALL